MAMPTNPLRLLAVALAAAVLPAGAAHAAETSVTVTVGRTVSFDAGWTCTVRLPAATPAASDGNSFFLSVNTTPYWPCTDPYGAGSWRQWCSGGLVVGYSSASDRGFIAFGSVPAAARPSLRSTIARMRGTAATTMSVSYNARKDRLTITAGAVRKVIPAVHEYMAELGLDDISEVSIDDVRVVMDGAAVVAVDGVSFAAAQP
jgi:hypothetical protein